MVRRKACPRHLGGSSDAMTDATHDEDFAELLADCTRATLEQLLTEKFRAGAVTRDELNRLFFADVQANPALRPTRWSSHALFDWLPHAIMAELIFSHLTPKEMAKVATVCSDFSGCISDACDVCVARLGLRLPADFWPDESAARRLWHLERHTDQ